MKRPSDEFLKKHFEDLIEGADSVLDIGGGLRIDRGRSNRVDSRQQWARNLLKARGMAYRVLDYVDTYNPDIVGDIQELPLPDESEKAIVCLSVLEHVENPFKAASELYRVLAPGAKCLIYVPFLFYYHAEKGYYGDYWRFTEDSLRLLFRPFTELHIQPTRGPIETLIRLSPLGRYIVFCNAGFLLDRLFKKQHSRQTSGYNLFLIK